MVTSGTGHDRCPSPGPGPTGARAPPFDGDRKISKTVFGFKRAEEFSLKPPDTPAEGANGRCEVDAAVYGGSLEPFAALSVVNCFCIERPMFRSGEELQC